MNWPAAKWFLAAESTVPETGNCSASPFPDADTLKKKVIFKKDFWLNFMVFRIWLKVREGQNLPLSDLGTLALPVVVGPSPASEEAAEPP